MENLMKMYTLFALYGGPDQLMPITSGLTAIFAFILIFWNKVLVAAGKLLNLFRSSPSTATSVDNPTAESTKRSKREMS
jgi:hypothetical protein